MNGSEYLLWSYGQFEKMSFFPPDPLLEGHLELIADGFEPVSFVFFVSHAFVWVKVMGLLCYHTEVDMLKLKLN